MQVYGLWCCEELIQEYIKEGNLAEWKGKIFQRIKINKMFCYIHFVHSWI